MDSAAVDPPDGPSDERVEVPAPPEAAARLPAPWEAPPGNAVDPAGAIDRPAPWRGYNPDYVADQMVPMIHARATTGWRSWLGLRPSKAELRRKRLQAEMCVNFGQPVKIVLANPRGYAGKTTMAICLAGVLGVARGGGVCAFENHELRGTMSLRTVTNGTQRTTRDFIHNLSQMTPDQVRQADLSRYVRHQHAGNFDAMVTSRSFEKQLDGDEYRAASALLGRFYEVIVVDTANNEAHEAFQAAMEDATVLVVPTKWRPTHITPAAADVERHGDPVAAASAAGAERSGGRDERRQRGGARCTGDGVADVLLAGGHADRDPRQIRTSRPTGRSCSTSSAPGPGGPWTNSAPRSAVSP